MAPLGADEHQADRPQHAQVLGHLGLAEAEPVDELADGHFSRADGVQEIATARLRDGVERVGRRRGASHTGNHIPIWECVNRYRWSLTSG